MVASHISNIVIIVIQSASILLLCFLEIPTMIHWWWRQTSWVCRLNYDITNQISCGCKYTSIQSGCNVLFWPPPFEIEWKIPNRSKCERPSDFLSDKQQRISTYIVFSFHSCSCAWIHCYCGGMNEIEHKKKRFPIKHFSQTWFRNFNVKYNESLDAWCSFLHLLVVVQLNFK